MVSSSLFKNRRVYLLTTIAYLGALLFGYDTGVMGSVLAMKSFKQDFGLPVDSSGFSTKKNANISSNVVSLLTAGCFFGAIMASYLNERFGRRPTLMAFAVVFLIGAAVQTAAHHEIGQIYAGRIVAGLGIGGMSAVTPVFVSENCPAKVRGRITGLFQEFLVIGSTFAYWLDYGVALRLKPSTKQWRIPVGVQLIPGGLMLLGLFFLKESPRWLMKQGRHDEALASLAHVRCTTIDDPAVLVELAEIRAAVEEEYHLTEGVKWKEVLKPGVRYRFITAFVLMFCQQFSGTNSIGYYAPQIFQTVGVSKTNSSLFATGVYGTVKVVATAVFLWAGIETIGRRKALIGGALWMMSMMMIIGSVLETHPPLDVNHVSKASIAMVVMIYLYVIGYSASWGPTPWVYLSEIFPPRLRAYGTGMGASTQWLFNFVITQITPRAINSLGWKTFIMFGCFCFGNAIFAFFFIKETKGVALESMDVLFGTVDADKHAVDVERILAEEKGIAVEHFEVAPNSSEPATQHEETKNASVTQNRTIS